MDMFYVKLDMKSSCKINCNLIKRDDCMLKKKIIIHLLSLCVLCIGFVLYRYVFFDIHGMKQWPGILFGIGIIALVISFFLDGKITPICIALSYIIGFIVGIIFQTDGIDPGGARTNNLWIIWTVVFICITLVGIIYDKFISTAKKKIR